MDLLQSAAVQCPYCGETLDIDVDCSVPEQSYIEDCQVCCQPINVQVSVIDDAVSVITRHENA